LLIQYNNKYTGLSFCNLLLLISKAWQNLKHQLNNLFTPSRCIMVHYYDIKYKMPYLCIPDCISTFYTFFSQKLGRRLFQLSCPLFFNKIMLKTAPLKKLLNNYVYSLSFHSLKKKNKHDNDYPLQVFKKKKKLGIRNHQTSWNSNACSEIRTLLPFHFYFYFYFLASNLTRLLEEQVIDSFTKFLKNYKNSSLHKKD